MGHPLSDQTYHLPSADEVKNGLAILPVHVDVVAAERVLVVPGGARVLLHVARVTLKAPNAARRPRTRVHLAQHAPRGGRLLRHLQGAAASQNQLNCAAFCSSLRMLLIFQTHTPTTVHDRRAQIDTVGGVSAAAAVTPSSRACAGFITTFNPRRGSIRCCTPSAKNMPLLFLFCLDTEI